MTSRFWLLLMMAVAMTTSRIDAASAASDQDEALFLKRLNETGANGRESYDTMEAVPGVIDERSLPQSARPTLSLGARETAKAYALANNSKALLIWRDGALEESVYAPGVGPATLINAKSLAKPLSAIAIGRAIKLGLIRSPDQSASDFITEWRGTPKAAITLRQLMDMTSGLAEQGAIKDPDSVMSRAYLHPRHGDVIVNDYPLTATPGVRYQYSNASADLIAVVIERASGRRYATFISEEVLRPLGASGGQVWVDRPGGLAHSGCCILLPATTWLRLGLLLLNDGVWEHKRLLPDGYVAAMKTTSVSNPRYGMGVWVQGDYIQRRGFGRPDQLLGAVLHSEPYLAKDLFLFDGNADQVVYMIPSKKLVILRVGDAPPKSPAWDNAFLPNLILRDLAGH